MNPYGNSGNQRVNLSSVTQWPCWSVMVSEFGRVKMVHGSVEGSDRMSKLSSGADVFSPVVKKSPLTVSKKIYEFYTAPITKFWMHTVIDNYTYTHGGR